MVMEASPSPQCVGREFVRQYYTLLNRAPTHLHRFYNNYSSFVHGSVDSSREPNPAIGQKQIHQKIQALNFQDCHAKINQVDSQSTLGNGVVVQVSGELSNAGHPMRRFTQTFVLAAQAPKKYYVHNDIFRYQDYGYTDEEDEEIEGESNTNENANERESEVENTRPENEEEDQQSETQQLTTKMSNIDLQSPTQQVSSMNQQQQQIYYTMPPQQQVHPVIQQVTINGSIHDDSSIMSQQSIQLQQSSLQQQQYVAETATQEQYQQDNQPNSQQQQQLTKTDNNSTSEEIHQEPESEQNYTLSSAGSDADHQIISQNISNNGPKTYANLVKSFPSAGTTSPQVSKPQISISPPPSLRSDDRVSSYQSSVGLSLSTSPGSQINHVHRVIPQQPSQQQQYQQRLPRTGGLIQRDGEHRTGRPGFPDSHQLFLGNLPHNASESDLRQVFERYGRVADLRVHSKQNDRSKGPQGTNSTRVPNYGFITFEDMSVVKLVLADCPIYFPDKHGQKLNIEEKKVRPREVAGGSGRSNLGDNNMRPLATQQQQRGSGGPATMMRGGQHGTRGRGGYNRGGGEGGRGGLRQQSGNPNNQNYQTRR
ncbi:ras GTPase-activating protein-binding protein 2 [Phymastichus coffea]|uniref:ras GTPase-activating protein-binding protein 2 n=1 Tax=Phymastichus coffea TaxID=108790 RepID=UPI00273CDEF0|nr:ras GTPase-activating protein-binding protein 2 [Phymastichus coffea]XP_058810285.1 ras GTPase-activating protein-binding protein 2 [Phymastichus coffea]